MIEAATTGIIVVTIPEIENRVAAAAAPLEVALSVTPVSVASRASVARQHQERQPEKALRRLDTAQLLLRG
jgi:hypothetical protein